VNRKNAKELLHIRDWLDRIRQIVDKGQGAYLEDALLQEASDSLMMKVGEASNRLSRSEMTAPPGIDWSEAVANRNWLIHQYDEIDRHVTWTTMHRDLSGWRIALAGAFDDAEAFLAGEAGLGEPGAGLGAGQ
jgi:uncharacterized protein with HEPN domain